MSAPLRARWLVAPALLALMATATVVLLSGQSTQASPGQTFRVSVDSAGNQANARSGYYSDGAISADGRYVAFDSDASNLVAGDTNGVTDVFVHDRETGETARASVDSAGNQANARSAYYGDVAISADGRYVAFHSEASNLVPGDTNGAPDAFVHDRQTGQTTRVSVDSAGSQANAPCSSSLYCGPAMSADGRYVAFRSRASNLVLDDGNGADDVFVHDRQTGETARVSISGAGSEGNGESSSPALSADGRYVVFSSGASNLVSDDTNGYWDVFVHDRQTGETTRVSVDSNGLQASFWSGDPSISADGRKVTFSSSATNLATGDTNGQQDVFLHDRQTGETTLVSVDSDGLQGNGWSARARISADGQHVVFQSMSSNLVPGDMNGSYDVFARDSQTGETSRVSVDSSGNEANDWSASPAISDDGRYVAFTSVASDLVPDDTNATRDVFIHDRLLPFWTPTATSTATPTVTPTPAPDSDGDGCSDAGEAVMGFDPLAWYDFYDVPVPANPDMTPNGARNQVLDMGDALAVLFYSFSDDDGPPNANGVDYDSIKGSCDYDGDMTADEEGLCYDRSPGTTPNPPWDAGPPNGTIDVGDVLAVLAQAFAVECLAPPGPTPTATATSTASPTPTATPTPNPAAIDAVVQATADLLGVPPESVTVVSVERQDWPDSCLGLGQPGDICLMVIVPGYRITVNAGFTLVWRTDLDGFQVRLEATC